MRNGRRNERPSTVLFMAESVTLAQVVRLSVLARSIPRSVARVVFATSHFDPLVFRELDAEQVVVKGPNPNVALDAVARGKPYHDLSSLEASVAEDHRVFERVQPDLVVGDLRPSLAVSAREAQIPYANLINAYWSPRAVRDRVPMPDHPIVSLVGVERAARYFPKAMPHVFRHFARPYRELRRRHGIADIEDLFDLLLDGDATLFPDIPSIAPLTEQRSSELFLGAIPWQPPVPLPAFWSELRRDVPLVYATLGSSGQASRLEWVLDALSELDVEVVAATAGRVTPRHVPRNAHVADYLPGEVLARAASIVISNGGSSTGYQALAAGKPVIGIASNLDQYLATDAIVRAGAGLGLRAGTLRRSEITVAVRAALADSSMQARARELALTFARHDPVARFGEFLRSTLPGPGAALDSPREAGGA